MTNHSHWENMNPRALASPSLSWQPMAERRWGSTRAFKCPRLAKRSCFLARHDKLYHANRPHAEVLLLFPRSKVHKGDVESVTKFRELGTQLLNKHILFDILPDDLLKKSIADRYRTVLSVSEEEKLPEDLSQFGAPKTVRASASRPRSGSGVTLHFVNYNRIEPKKKRSAGGGIKDEKPIAVEKVKVDFVLPEGVEVKSVTMSTPESKSSVSLKYRVENGRIQFEVPRFLVYAIAHIEAK